MNIFGLFFTFMIPGILLGLLAAAVLGERAKEKKRHTAAVKRALYVHDLRESASRAA